MSQPSNTDLPTYLQRKIDGVCTRCGKPVAGLASLCDLHLDDHRKRTRLAMRKRRKKNRRKRRCIDCGNKSKRRRCPRCYRRTRGVSKPQKGVSKREQIWRNDPGTSWNRYRGKGRRGRLTREEQLEEDAREARFAIAEIGKFLDGLDDLRQSDVLELPPIQREAARREVGQYVSFADRILDGLCDKYG